MPSPPRHRTKLFAAFAAVYLIWGSTYLAIRYAVLTIPPFLMAGTRFLVSGALMYAWARTRPNTPAPTPKHWRNTAIAGTLLLFGGNGGVTWSEQTVPSGIVALVVATVPLWIVVLYWLRPGGTRPSIGVAAGIIVGLLGMITLIGPNTLLGHTNSSSVITPLGAGILTLAALSWATGTLFARGATMPRSSIMVTAMEMLAGGAVLTLFGLITGEWRHLDIHHITQASLLGLAYLITFGSLIGFTSYSWLIKHASPAAVGTYAYVNPVVAVLLGWLIAREPVTTQTLLGAAIIIAAVAIITTTQSRQKQEGRPS